MTITQLNTSILNRLSNRVNDDFKEEIKDLLNSYLINLKTISNNEKSIVLGEDYISKWDLLENKIKGLCKTLIEVIDNYYRGEIYTCLNKLMPRLEGDINNPGILYSNLKTYNILPDNLFYRIRIKDEKRFFTSEEMFHIPFEKRGVIKTQRYSIPGYPCLYLGKSIYGCWEEMRRPDLSTFYISLLKSKFDVKILDLRLPTNIECSESLLITWPLIMACSIKVKDDKYTFKPEYIIPQFILQILIRNRGKHGFQGIIYTSTQKNIEFGFDGDDIFDNIAVPVVDSLPTGLCSILSGFFQITKPICYEHELIKYPSKVIFDNTINGGTYGDDNDNDDDFVKYTDSIFGILEKRLKEKTTTDISS